MFAKLLFHPFIRVRTIKSFHILPANLSGSMHTTFILCAKCKEHLHFNTFIMKDHDSE